MNRALILGTRGSRLALVQAETCAERLRANGFDVQIRTIKTTSEHLPETPLAVIDQRDVFTRQLDEALLSGEIDLAIHSLKDIPTELPEGIVIAAVTERHDPRDVLVSSEAYTVDSLPDAATVATSSLRRAAQLLNRRPDLRVVGIRGNIDTRLRKVREGRADALVLARAGLERLGLEVTYTVIPPDIMLPAVGQGALAATVLGDHPLRDGIRESLNEPVTERASLAERAMLRALGGGCRVPVGALGRVADGGNVWLLGRVVSPDGALRYAAEMVGVDPDAVGVDLAAELARQGAAAVLDEIRGGLRR